MSEHGQGKRMKDKSSMTKCKAADDGQHMFEASTTVYLDIDEMHIAGDGTVILDDISTSHVNDEYRGERMDLEANFKVSCALCGEDFAFDISDEFRKNMGLQPIGDAPRTLDNRGGIN
jgi:hypothetical protein